MIEAEEPPVKTRPLVLVVHAPQPIVATCGTCMEPVCEGWFAVAVHTAEGEYLLRDTDATRSHCRHCNKQKTIPRVFPKGKVGEAEELQRSLQGQVDRGNAFPQDLLLPRATFKV